MDECNGTRAPSPAEQTAMTAGEGARVPFVLALLVVQLLVQAAFAVDGQKTFTIGVSTALTGGAANYGADVRNAAEFAAKKFGGGRIKLIFEDDKCDGKAAAGIANKFVHVDKVDGVVGYACSSAALAAAPIFERAKIPTIVTCGSAATIRDAGEYIFRTTPSDALAAARLFKHVRDRHQTFGILSEETEYCQGLKNGFIRSAEGSGIKVVTEDVLPDTADFRPVLGRLRAAGVEGLFVNGQTEGATAEMVDQLFEMKWDPKLYGAYWGGSPAFLKLAGAHAEKIELVDTPGFDQLVLPEQRGVLEEFLREYGPAKSIESIIPTTIEGVRILFVALSSGGDAQQFLLDGKFEAMWGPFSFDRYGEVEGIDFVIKRIRDGKPEVVN